MTPTMPWAAFFFSCSGFFLCLRRPSTRPGPLLMNFYWIRPRGKPRLLYQIGISLGSAWSRSHTHTLKSISQPLILLLSQSALNQDEKDVHPNALQSIKNFRHPSLEHIGRTCQFKWQPQRSVSPERDAELENPRNFVWKENFNKTCWGVKFAKHGCIA